MSGGLGDDIFQVVGDDGLDIIDGGDGTDTLLGSVYNDTFASNLANLNSIEAIDGGAGTNDRILGTTGDDTIDLSGIAISGVELIDGGAGDDIITASSANDILRGAAGSDVFIFKTGFGHDTIADFSAEGLPGDVNADIIDLSDFGFDNFAEVVSQSQQTGSDTLITIDAQSSLLLQNIQLTQLQSDDFQIG